ncbi:hypothetical protein P7C70_g1631, partial [Phenoliferia sp. Uapishka_3]
MPPTSKATLAAVRLGKSTRPEDTNYFFCTCTPCTTSYADKKLNRRGKWSTWGTWNSHRKRALAEGRDAEAFSANPLVGHVRREAYKAVKPESDVEGDAAGVRSEAGSGEEPMEGVMEGRYLTGDGGAEDHLGGHDEFVWDGEDGQTEEPLDTEKSDDVDLIGNEDEACSAAGSDEVTNDEESDEGEDPDDHTGDEEESDDESVAQSEVDIDYPYPEADEGPLWYDQGEGSDVEIEDVREGEAEDEEAQLNHHRPRPGDEEEPFEQDEREDEDENLARMLDDVDLLGFAPRADSPDLWPDFDDFGGGGVDFDDENFDDDQDGAEGDGANHGDAPDVVPGAGGSDDEEQGGNDDGGDGDEPGEGDGGDNSDGEGEEELGEEEVEREDGDKERSPPPAFFDVPGAGRPTAARASRLPHTPVQPCVPPNRTLTRDEMVQLHLFEMAVDHAVGPKLMDRIRWIFKQTGIDIPAIKSCNMLRKEAHRLARPNVIWFDHCPGHISSSNPATKDWRFCPILMNIKLGEKSWGTKLCGQPRYFPLNTPNLKALRKNSQRLGQQLPPLDKVPVAQHSHMSIEPFIDALYANPEQSADILRGNRASAHAAATDADKITSYETAEMPRKLYHPETGLCWEEDIILSTTSDGADIYPDACPNQPVKAHVAAVRLPCLTCKGHDFCYVCGVNGPRKGPTTLYLHQINADLEELEKPKRRYCHALGGMVTSRVFAGLNCSDTVEQCDLSNTVGAAGRCPSMLHDTRGVWNLLKKRWQYPLKSFARDDTLEDDKNQYDERGDVRTVLDDAVGDQDDGHIKYPSIVRDLPTYEKTNAALEAATTEASAVRIRRRTGIKGRSIYASLGIFSWVYPWIFALDDMHVTYSNNMKHFLVSMFGKSGKKKTARGKMVSSVNHFKMAKELRRTIHLQPSAHGQKVRGIEHLNRLKAAETRSFIWFHLAPLFNGYYEHRQDMNLVIAAIRSTRLTNHRVISRGAAFDTTHKTYVFDNNGDFSVPLANIKHAQDDFLIKRENLFVGRDYEYGATCSPSMLRSKALPDMCRLWGPGLLATTQWALEGKIGDLKRLAKSRALPVKNMENNNINNNMMVLIRLKYDFPKYDPTVSADLRHQHPFLPSTTFMHKKEPKPKLTDPECEAIDAYLRELGVRMSTSATPTRWQRVQLSTDEIIGSISRERGTELERIVIEDGAEEDEVEKERLGTRRATRFCKYTLRPSRIELEPEGFRSHQLFEVDSYLCVPLAPDNRPLFIALGRTFPTLVDRFRIHQAFRLGNAKRNFIAIGVEQIRHGVGLTLGVKRPEDVEPLWWVTMNVHKATRYLMSQERA